MYKEVTNDLSKGLLITWKNIAKGEPQTQWGNNEIYIYIPCNSHKTYQVQHKVISIENPYIIYIMIHFHKVTVQTYCIMLIPFYYLLQLCILVHCPRESMTVVHPTVGGSLARHKITRRSFKIKLDGIAPKGNTHPISISISVNISD